MMNTRKYFLIHVNIVMFLLGYWLMHSFLSVVTGDSSRTASIVFNGIMLALSIYIIAICRKDFGIERGKPLLTAFSITLILYAVRMVMDVYVGPFSYILPDSEMWNDVVQIVGGVFFPTWAMIASRKYIDINIVSRWIFWTGTVTCLFVLMDISIHGISFEEERVVAGRGLHSLALAKLGAIELMASVHILINSNGVRRWIPVIGLVLGGFVALASGSRGSVVGVIVAISFYLIMAVRKYRVLMMMGVVVIIILAINIVAVLDWLEGFFPVFSYRMREAVIEGDNGGRNDYFQEAMQYIGENPLLGYGYRLNADSTGYGPHNGILEIFLCFGVPLGLIFTFFIYIKSVVCSVLMMADKRFVFVSLMVIFSIVSSMSGSSISTSTFDFSIALLGIAYYYGFRRK